MSQSAPAFPPFKWGWYSFDLGKYRPCDGTYCLYPYESIPPLPIAATRLDGSLDWLTPPADATDARMEVYRPSDEARARLTQRLDATKESAAQLGLTLPTAFVTLMASPELQDHIPSCTACDFRLAEQIVPCPGREGAYLIRFLHDQQDVLLWDLYLTTAGQQCVIVSPYDLATLEDDLKQHPEVTLEQVLENNVFACAPSFAEFIYRFWLENTIWFSLNESDGPTLTTEQSQYLSHYSAL
ncbi:MAG TPA: hypothetical protein VKQ36_00775 [Ktedonobacterales bacterium]|nr:hypothetical protein [Ktedonobacterales bacterium]